MVDGEEEKHCPHCDAYYYNEREWKFLVKEVSHNDVGCGLYFFLSQIVCEFCIPKVLRVNDAPKDEHSNYSTIETEDCVREYEGNEVPIVVEPNTIVDPDAVMIEFLNADIA